MKSAASREVNEIRAQYEARFLSAWARSDELFGLIRDDRLDGQADSLAASVSFLRGSPASVFLESDLWWHSQMAVV